MRFVIFGAGAVGGVVGARLHQGGFGVTLIARGAHLEAIRRDGLTLLTPVERVTLRLPAAADPAEVDWSDQDVVLLATKSQDTLGALTALRATAGTAVPVVCLQNGVENERLALRLMARVYGAVVMAPTAHLEPGIVESYGAELSGMIDVGRYPSGVDERTEQICGALSGAMFASRPSLDIMRLKYAKLLLNLGNAVRALCEPGERRDELAAQARAEGEAALTAAGINFVADEVTDVTGRWTRMGVREIEGRRRAGSSTWQSLARGTGTIETDYLNGEIVLQGRSHGVPTPVNEALCRLAAHAAREGRGGPGLCGPNSIAPEEVLGVTA
jgi:2-dehydropantoate 2-reductase